MAWRGRGSSLGPGAARHQAELAPILDKSADDRETSGMREEGHIAKKSAPRHSVKGLDGFPGSVTLGVC